MLDVLLKVLPIFIYLLLMILIVVFIIVGVKIINALNKTERVIDNVEDKVNSLNGFFNVIENTTSKISGVYEKSFTVVSGLVNKILSRKHERDEEDE